MSARGIKYLIVLAAIFVLSAGIVNALPAGPMAPDTLIQDTSSKMDLSVYSLKSLNAEAGNLTQITMTSVSQTRSWQGYYGNISGIITLDDASNYTMYAWDVAEPTGEIYVVNTTITDWTTAHCLNYTAAPDDLGVYSYTYDGGAIHAETSRFSNLTTVENNYNISKYNMDGVNETFSTTVHREIFVGTTWVEQNTCPSTRLYQSVCFNSSNELNPDGNDNCTNFNDGFYWEEGPSNGNDFVEVLLQVNDSSSVIWTTLIENDIDGNDTDIYGFNGNQWDFQVIVGEDGSSLAGQDTTTLYYFYVELE